MSFFGPLVAFVGVLAVALAVYLGQTARSSRLSRLRQRLAAPERKEVALVRQEGLRFASLQAKLASSGLGWTLRDLTLASVALGLLVGLVSYLFAGAPVALALGLIAGLAPYVRVELARRERLSRCGQQIPSALRLVTLALRAGTSLPAALALAARESPAPLREELGLAVQEHSMGASVPEVFQHLASRLPESEALRTLAVAVSVLERTGGNLIRVIDNIIESARNQSLYVARLRALTSQGRWSARILTLLPPLFFLFAGLMEKSYWPTLFSSTAGWVVFGMSLSFWMGGALWTFNLASPARAGGGR